MADFTLIPLSQESLFEKLENLIDSKLSGLTNAANIPEAKTSEEIVTRKEAKHLLGVSYPTMREWEKLGLLKKRTIGRRVYYLRSEIMEALSSSLETKKSAVASKTSALN
ncbi:helix-turn-helix domain-containing protein [Cryomorphaceae bacterium 1068]|nr:helix-turn-helix domain-containing protein [Cryomorphaceae bacterium 1068]